MHRNIAIIATAALLMSCSASPDSEEKENPAAVPEAPASAQETELQKLDDSYEVYLEENALPKRVEQADRGIGDVMKEKTDSMIALRDRYAEFVEAEDPVDAAHARLRVGQLYLNLGCEIATTEYTVGETVTEEIADRFESLLIEQATPFLGESKEMFGTAAKLEGGRFSETAQQILTSWAASPGGTCTATREYWASEARPDIHAARPPTPEECREDLTVRDYDPACKDVLQKTCADGEGDDLACLGLGMIELKATGAAAAFEWFERSCKLGNNEGCRAQIAISVEQRKGDYREDCDRGNAVGCMQLARLLDRTQGRKLTEECEADDPLPAPGADAQKKCLDGSAGHCWARAASLLAKTPLDLPAVNAAVMGSSDLQVGYDAGKDVPLEEWKALNVKRCAKKDPRACVTVGEALAKEGQDPLPNYRRGCDIGSQWACTVLGRYLIDLDDEERVNEGVNVLVEACTKGWDAACIEVAKLFHAGKKAPESKACAAALTWQNCTPRNLMSCADPNEVFHGK